MQASFELELQVGVIRSCGAVVYLAKIVDMWHIDAHGNAHSLLANAPSNKPLEWTGHHRLLACVLKALPATQGQRSALLGAVRRSRTRAMQHFIKRRYQEDGSSLGGISKG